MSSALGQVVPGMHCETVMLESKCVVIVHATMELLQVTDHCLLNRHFVRSGVGLTGPVVVGEMNMFQPWLVIMAYTDRESWKRSFIKLECRLEASVSTTVRHKETVFSKTKLGWVGEINENKITSHRDQWVRPPEQRQGRWARRQG